MQFLRQGNAFQQRIFTLFSHIRHVCGVVSPQPGLVTVVTQNQTQSGTPTAAAQYDCFHDGSSLSGFTVKPQFVLVAL